MFFDPLRLVLNGVLIIAGIFVIVFIYKNYNKYTVTNDNINKEVTGKYILLALCIIILLVLVNFNHELNNIQDNMISLEQRINMYSNELNEVRANNYAQDIDLTSQTFYLEEAANYLGLTSEQLQSIVDDENSEIPYIKVGYMHQFYKDALDNWLKTSRIEIDSN